MSQIVNVENFSWWQMVKAVWYFLKEDRKKFVIVCIILLLVFTYTLLPVFIIGRVVDFLTHYNPGDDLTKFYFYCLALGGSWIVASIIRITAKRHADFITTDTVYRAKVEGFERLMDFSIKWHQNENTGNKVQRIQTGTQGIKNFLKVFNSKIMPICVSTIGVLSIFLFLNYKFVVFLGLYMGLFFYIEWYFYSKVQKANNEFNAFNEKSSGTYFESANNVLTIKTLGVKDTVKSNVSSSEDAARNHSKKVSRYGFNKWQSFQILNGITLGIFILMIGLEVINGTMAVGMILVYFTYYQKLKDATQDGSELVGELIEFKSGVARMMPIFWHSDSFNDGEDPFPNEWDKISIKDGNFRYKTEEDNFNIKNLNIEIKKYEKVGIVGHSGSGKSTLAKLMLGVYALENGEFKIGDKNFYEIEHTDLTKHISTVLQETELFNLTLKENITMMKEAEGDLLDKVIRIAQLEEVISRLPDGINTMIGEKGYKLSGGERQRLGIARAVYSNAEVLVLDEATSALDSKTESLIQEAIEKELTKKTLVIIAHRLSTLKNVDKIYVFERGEIVESGKFDELIKDSSSRFAEMYSLQQREK